jgi:hypothetical protein
VPCFDTAQPCSMESAARSAALAAEAVLGGLALAPPARLAAVLRPALRLLTTPFAQARLRMMQFRGLLSATLVYDDIPVEDVFRSMNEETMLGLMNLKGLGQPFFFVLRRDRLARPAA